MNDFGSASPRLAIIGLGYVGLPLALAFGRHYPTIGFDVRRERIQELCKGHDSTLESQPDEFGQADQLTFADDPEALSACDVFIVTVPTPIDRYKRPDLTPLRKASETIGRVLKSGDTVIYESTVYPGATEEYCVPILEALSGLRYAATENTGERFAEGHFFCGYSPERINPGDKQHRLANIKKVTSGSTPEAAAFVDRLYGSIITAGTHRAPSIRVAEAAKVIENTQRDVNIALINELAMVFKRLGIDTQDVLRAAGTKWNVAAEIVKLMSRRGLALNPSRILILGFTFKENCPDLRNTRVIDIVRALEEYGATVEIHDPWASPAEARHEYGVELIEAPASGAYSAVVMAVSHDSYRSWGIERVRSFGAAGAVVFDVKYLFAPDEVDGRL
jgi:UDP-N-acetyl-D-galactosamine dehydrogenase